MEKTVFSILQELTLARAIATTPSKRLHMHHMLHHIEELEKELNSLLVKTYGDENDLLKIRTGRLDQLGK